MTESDSGASDVTVVGGGLAGCEAAVQLARRGRRVKLVEMRPVVTTAAHQTDSLGELVCTNSFKSEDPSNAHGALKREMHAMGSILLASACVCPVSRLGPPSPWTANYSGRPWQPPWPNRKRIEVVREEYRALPAGPTIIATGPLTSDGLAEAVRAELGEDGLAFYDGDRSDPARRVSGPVRRFRGRSIRGVRRLPELPDEQGGVRGVHRRPTGGRRP